MSKVSKVFNRDVRLTGGAELYVNEVRVIDANGNVDAPVTSTDLTLSGTLAVTGASTFTGAVTGAAAMTNTIADIATAAPSNVRSIIGQVTNTTTMTSGLITGVRGLSTVASASGGFVYGTQGKLAVTGTLSGSVWAAGVFGQLDMSAATTNAGQVAAIRGDRGATSGTETDMTGARGIVMTNTTDATLNAQVYLYGKATYLLELAGPGSSETYVATAGTSAGSAGETTKCNANKVLTISIDGVAHYIPVFTSNS